ncbi:hypothetical protein AK812_SmicGene23890 [Symbiodinium microadriaticum]|uniref:Uncharacterized protein n=1 Tax=Symbiodinium microadriaticum TaxID=2951 RepID=A0A1Q9DGD0_SYMMI|nr:hypothetical protein AK812_SmicGene23890 [Symbiodinium microadriaticum]
MRSIPEVAKLESCKECRRLTAALVGGPVTGKRAAKQRKALEVHKRQHQDVDAVSLEALDAEVRRLCAADAASPSETTPAVTEPKVADAASELAPAPKKRTGKNKRKWLLLLLLGCEHVEQATSPSTGFVAVEMGPMSSVWVLLCIIAAVQRSRALFAFAILYQGLCCGLCRYLANTKPYLFFLGHLAVAAGVLFA